jgi:hypothetical protein
MTNTGYVKEFTEKTRDLLRAAYARLTPEQVEKFNQMYGSLEAISYDKLPWAYSLVMRSLEPGKSKDS